MGYPSNIIFVSTLDCYICVVCHEMMKDPASCKECGHTFCQQCIDTCLSSSSTNSCPSCRVIVTGTNPNFFARDTIESLQVKCVHHCSILDDDNTNTNNNTNNNNDSVFGNNKEQIPHQGDDDNNANNNNNQNGCNWVGPLKDLQNHQEQCEWKTITCPTTDGCNFQCKRRDMDKHLTSGTGILRHMELMKSSFETKLKAMETKIHRERNHFKYLNDCRAWIEHASDALLSTDFKVHQIKTRIHTTDDDYYEYVTGLYCSIPAGKTHATGLHCNIPAIIPVLIKYDSITGLPMCRFPKGFLHTNVLPSGKVTAGSIFEWDKGTKFSLPEFLGIVQKNICCHNKDVNPTNQTEGYKIIVNDPLEFLRLKREEALKYKKESFFTDIYAKNIVFDPEYIDLNHEHIGLKDIVSVDLDLFPSNHTTNKDRLLELLQRLDRLDHNDEAYEAGGFSIEQCVAELHDISKSDIQQAMHLLAEAGHVYSTIDENTFMIAR